MAKRNNEAIRSERHKKTTKGKSKYAQKVASGQQMYGPGCCAHRITESQMATRRELARKERMSEERAYYANKRFREFARDPSWDQFMGTI